MGQANGVQEPLDNVGALLPRPGRVAAPVRQVLFAKHSRDTYTIGPRETVFDALSRMAAKNIGALVVVDGGLVVGVVSERDYARKVILIGKSSRETAVEEIMGTPAVTVTSATTVGECLALMTGRFLRHLPVVDEGQLIGIVSIGDLVKALIADQEERIGRIEAYISGTYPG